MRKGRRTSEECELNMTPMIDVVFQLIIFFIVTINISESRNETIRLEEGRHGIPDDPDNRTVSLTIEIGQDGRVSISNFPMTYEQLQGILANRRRRLGPSFPILIRADYRAPHIYIANIMNLCAAQGFPRVSFVAVLDPRTDTTREHIQRSRRLRGGGG